MCGLDLAASVNQLKRLTPVAGCIGDRGSLRGKSPPVRAATGELSTDRIVASETCRGNMLAEN
jgi:hypothetical protein